MGYSPWGHKKLDMTECQLVFGCIVVVQLVFGLLSLMSVIDIYVLSEKIFS